MNDISIIGDADGPTAIFVAAAPCAGWFLFVLILLLAAGILFVSLRHKKK